MRQWPATSTEHRGTVLIVHGLGEHSGRYAHVASRLAGWGWAVRAYDHRGHGRSGGARGSLRAADDLLTDLATIVDHGRTGTGGALVLLGHSLGGAVAADFVLQRIRRVDALVLSSPAIDPGLSLVNRSLLVLLGRLAPDLAIPSRLKTKFLSHDVDVVKAYRADPLVHDRVTARLVRYLVDAGRRVHAAAERWDVPTLLLWAGEDRLVRAGSTAEFAALTPRTVVETQRYDLLYHELFNELEAEPVFERLAHWLNELSPLERGSPPGVG